MPTTISFSSISSRTDTAGEDGDFERKVRVIEEVDAALPRLIDLKPEVIVVTGDHSTPPCLKVIAGTLSPSCCILDVAGRMM